jgi:glutamate-1-semialdehyde 2,1-aminomutase
MNSYQRSAELYAEACRHTPGGVHTSIRNLEPHQVWKSAQGAYITDVDGNRFLDYQAAFGPFILGHNNPAVTSAVKQALDESDLFGTGTSVLEIKLAQKICQHVPSAESVLFTNSGSESTHHAIRLSRAFTKRRKMVKFQGCYHGWHDFVCRNVLSAPDKVMQEDPISTGILPEVLAETLVAQFNDLGAVEELFQKHPEQIACVIVEPIPHNIGCVLPKPGFLEGLRALCDMHGSVLIFDEVITGFRHALGGYQSICGVTPDLTTMGKAMANGFPIAAIAGKAALMNRFQTKSGGDVFFAGTYNGHAAGCAAALATINILEKPETYQHIFGLGDRMRDGLRQIHQRLGINAVVAGFRSVFMTYFMEGPIENYSDLLRNRGDIFIEYRRRLMERGIFKLPMNLKRNHIGLAHTQADIDTTLASVETVLKAMRSENRF